MYTKTLDVGQNVDLSALPAHLATCLRRKSARDVKVDGKTVTFRGGGFRWVTNWNVLCPFGFGDLTVDSVNHQVQYRLSLRQLIVVGSLATGFMAAVLLGNSVPQGLVLVPFIWLWFVCGNLAIGLPRFLYFVRRSIASAPRVKS